MKKYMDWFFTDHEEHMISYLQNNGGIYQGNQRKIAIELTKQKRTVIDIGANVGLWAKDFCNIFENVHCFEPVTETRKCLEKNLERFDNYIIHSEALGSENKKDTIKILLGSSGHSVVFDYARGMERTDIIMEENIDVVMLDDFNFTDVDLIKIDCQGYEYEIIVGARETLINNDPTLCVELPIRDENEKNFFDKVNNYLHELGYKDIDRHIKEVYYQK